MAITIENDIPVPGSGTSATTNTLRALEVGQSFVVPAGKRSSLGQRIAGCRPRRFVTRSIGNDMIRIWRTE